MPKSDFLVDRMKHFLSAGNDAANVHFLLLPAHKLILTAASDVFEAMFCGGKRSPIKKKANGTPRSVGRAAHGLGGGPFSEGIKPVEVLDVEVGTFKAMLSFIYADDLSGLNGDNSLCFMRQSNRLYSALHKESPTSMK
ncbi:hypothetical protein GPALN_012068 [Globodera pallida]|nr:hypothetical protein GPALN_012068 [Globodera pallida]